MILKTTMIAFLNSCGKRLAKGCVPSHTTVAKLVVAASVVIRLLVLSELRFRAVKLFINLYRLNAC